MTPDGGRSSRPFVKTKQKESSLNIVIEKRRHTLLSPARALPGRNLSPRVHREEGKGKGAYMHDRLTDLGKRVR